MNKRDFTKLIKQQIKDVPFEKQTQELYKMRDIIEQIASNIRKDQANNYVFCKKCGKYFRPTKRNQSREGVYRNVNVNMCWGEWDEPRWEMRAFDLISVKCPKCKEKIPYKETMRG